MNGDLWTPTQTWTPGKVKERLIEALTWARYCTGRVGPAEFVSTMPSYKPTLEDHLESGWGLPETAGDEREEEKAIKLRASPEQVKAYLEALEWMADYLAKDHPGLARTLGLWLASKVYRFSFENELRARGSDMTRTHAYRLRDRALSVISQGLQRDGVPL